MSIWNIPVPTKTADGHDAAHRALHDRLRRFIYAPDFGAVGDGVTDNTMMLQNAINRAEGGLVLLPPGLFITGGLTLPSGITLCGSGDATVLKLKDSANIALLRNSNVTAGNTDIHIRDLTLEGNRLNQARAVGHGIQFLNVQRASVVRCHLIDCGFDAIYLGMGGNFGGQITGGPCQDILITANTLVRARRNGISVTRAERVTIAHNTFEGCNIGTLEDSVYDAGSIDLEPNIDPDIVSRITIKNNVILSPYRRGIQIAGNCHNFSDIIIAENYLDADTGGGIVTFSDTARDVSILNNHIHNISAVTGILVGYAATGYMIRGNRISGGWQGITITNGGTQMVVSDNFIRDAAQGIQLASAVGHCDQLIIRNNTMINCTESIIVGNATQVTQDSNVIW